MPSSSHNWSDSNLRRRSFRGKDLTGANFRGADLRGSDFSQSILIGANLAQARLGLCPIAAIRAGLILLLMGSLGLQTLSTMIFGVMGMTPEDPNFIAKLLLIGFLGVGSILTAFAQSRPFRRILLAIAAIIQGLLFGCYWGGVLSNRMLLAVIAGGVFTAAILLMGLLFQERQGFGVLIFTLGTIFSNGLFFLAGVMSLQALVVSQWSPGVVWAIVSALYLFITLKNISALYQQLKTSVSTNFSGADLTQVHWQD